MKTLSKLSVILLMTFCVLTGCSSSAKLEYTEELSFLPKYPNSVKVVFEKGKENEFSTLQYKVEKVDAKKVTNEYEKLFVEDGWEVTKQEAAHFLECKKDSHYATVTITEADGNAIIDILAK